MRRTYTLRKCSCAGAVRRGEVGAADSCRGHHKQSGAEVEAIFECVEAPSLLCQRSKTFGSASHLAIPHGMCCRAQGGFFRNRPLQGQCASIC